MSGCVSKGLRRLLFVGFVIVAMTGLPAIGGAAETRAAGNAQKIEAPDPAGAGPSGSQPAEPLASAGEAPATEAAQVAPADPPPAPVLPPMDDILAPVKDVTGTIEALEKVVDRVKTSDIGLAQQRSQIDALIEDTEKAAAAIRPRYDAAKAQLDKLGPTPKAGQPRESSEIVTERARLTGILTVLEGALKSTELVRVRSSQLAAQVLKLRQGLFTQNLFERSGSPLLPGLWNDIAASQGRIALRFENVFGTWWAIIAQRWTSFLSILGAAGLVYLVLWFASRRMIARLSPRAPEHPPTYTVRASVATLAAPLYILPAVVAASILYVGFQSLDLVFSRVEGLLLDTYQGVLIFTVVSGLASAILTPRKPSWRLIDLADASAASLWRSIRLIALIYVTDFVFKELIGILDLPLAFHVALSFVTTIGFALVLLRVVTTPLVPVTTIIADVPEHVPPARVSRWHPRWLKLPLLIIALAIIVAALSGYVALARFAAGQVVITGTAVVLALLLHLGIRTTEKTAVSTDAMLGHWLANGLGIGETHRGLVGHSISAILNAGLALLAIPALMLAWGFSMTDVVGGMKSALFGFEIGHFRISLVQLFMALGLFAGLLFITRLMQRWLRATFLRPDRMDAGIANSIYQGIGYVGFAIAALLSISFGGIDITNLAIVAGALSVGIGFGLQSIANNFVSGLILLVERPIKVGDWIVLKDGGQGYVRSISVRSTEIETFDRSSLIVPNSELISTVVTNWTHRNALGRVMVKVATSYKSDPNHVIAVLTQCAKDSPMVMQQPAPLITLDSFGGDGLEFTVRVVVPDINRALGVQTQLRTAIFKAFKDQGIEFPTAERDIYLRDLDGLKSIVARVLEERAHGNSSSARPSEPGGEVGGGGGGVGSGGEPVRT